VVTWLNPRTGVIHAVDEDGERTVCGHVRIWGAAGGIDWGGEFSEEYLAYVQEEFAGPWSLCCHCGRRLGSYG